MTNYTTYFETKKEMIYEFSLVIQRSVAQYKLTARYDKLLPMSAYLTIYNLEYIQNILFDPMKDIKKLTLDFDIRV